MTRQRKTDEATPSIVYAARQEAEVRVHDRVSPDAAFDAIAAVSLYVEAFLAGARFAKSWGGQACRHVQEMPSQ